MDPVGAVGSVSLRVTGMTCASCVSTIERALASVPGVTAAKVNLATENALVHGDGLERPALVAAIEKSGYGVRSGTADQVDGKASAADSASARRLVVCAALTVPLVLLSMGPHILMLLGLHDGMQMGSGMEGMDMQGMEGMDMGSMDTQGMAGMDMPGTGPERDMMLDNAWPQLLLAAPVVAYGGAPVFRGAWRAWGARHVTMDSLVAVGVATAFGYSAVVTLRPDMAVGPGLYFETAAVIITLLLLGRRIEHGARRRAAARMEQAILADPARADQVRQVMEASQGSRLGIQAVADRLVRLFVPFVWTVAFASFLFWGTIGAPIAIEAGFTPQSMALLSFLGVLIIACPCGLGLAVPLAVMSGTSRAAQQGVLLRGGDALEAARTIDTVVVANRGILTAGQPEVAEVVPLQGSEQDVLALAAAAEAHSNHPIAVAIHRRSPQPSMAVTEASTVEGQGVQAASPTGKILVGRPQWLASQGIMSDAVEAQVKRIRSEGKTVVAVAHAGRLVGLIALADPAKATSVAAVRELQESGYEVVMLTGGDQVAAQAAASSLGIRRVLAEVAPQDRPAAIRRLRQEGRRVAFVGDGIRDAPALVEASLGIAMGPGDLTKQAGGITLLVDDPAGVAHAIRSARQTLRTAYQNLAWAFAYNVLLIPVAAGLLVAWPLFGAPMQLDPMYGAVAMTLSILSVVANSTRLRARGASEALVSYGAAPTGRAA